LYMGYLGFEHFSFPQGDIELYFSLG